MLWWRIRSISWSSTHALALPSATPSSLSPFCLPFSLPCPPPFPPCTFIRQNRNSCGV